MKEGGEGGLTMGEGQGYWLVDWLKGLDDQQKLSDLKMNKKISKMEMVHNSFYCKNSIRKMLSNICKVGFIFPLLAKVPSGKT